MNKKDFWLGLVLGIAIAMTCSMFLFNYYIGQKIEQTKQEAKEGLEQFKEAWQEEWREEMANLKIYAQQKATEKGGELLDNVTEELKKRWGTKTTEPDSLSKG